jgi:uncharacterized coiled-coil DUF342 family protein
MNWHPLHIKGLAFHSPRKQPAILRFESGLNVVWGASNVGKSFAVKAIDFMLGAKDPIADIPERVRYDKATLLLGSRERGLFTLQRSLSGKGFLLHDGDKLEAGIGDEGRRLSERHSQGKTDNLSGYLLEIINLLNKVVCRNQKGEAKNLSFRMLSRLVLIKEGDIIKEFSPILSGQYTDKTSEISTFKMLLTGLDDSAQVAEDSAKKDLTSLRKTNLAKIELIEELITEIRAELGQDGRSRSELEERANAIQQQIGEQESVIRAIGREIDGLQSQRRELSNEYEEVQDRIQEIGAQLKRFELLKISYRSDIDRLEFIRESGSVFYHMEAVPCPLCGTPPDEQPRSEPLDRDIESVVRAAMAESDKIQNLLEDLDDTIAALHEERAELTTHATTLTPGLEELHQQIAKVTAPISEAQVGLQALVQQQAQIQSHLQQFDRLGSYLQKKSTLEAETPEPEKPSAEPVVKADLSTTVLDQYAETVLELLQAWNFPDADRVHFDKKEMDLVINGQLRSTNGKGVRAVVHAAMTIGLMKFCQQQDLPHPGFVVLDSPLWAYKPPEQDGRSEVTEEDRRLINSDVKPRFYEYLSHHLRDAQVIVMENAAPPQDLQDTGQIIHFTKRRDVGRYGLFPVSE